MRLTVPFYENSLNDCGPIALQMVLEFLGQKKEYSEIKKLSCGEMGGVTFSIGLALAAKKLGCKTEFYSEHIGFNPSNFELDYYTKETSGASSVEKKLHYLHSECISAGVTLEEKVLSCDEILSRLNKDCMIIVLFDWSKISGVGEYLGHFMPIVGYDEKNVYLHQPGPKDPTPYFAISKELFDEARAAKGTDQDIIFIHRKS